MKLGKGTNYFFSKLAESFVHSRMASLDEEINVLKAKIDRYEFQLETATSPKVQSELREIIRSKSDNMTELLKQRNAQALGIPICFNQKLFIIL